VNKAEVGYSIGRTLNLGDFESVKVQVSLSMECEATKEEIEKTYQRAKRFVDAKVAEEEYEWKVG